jgi:1,4-alpha-glucan branching enzyme
MKCPPKNLFLSLFVLALSPHNVSGQSGICGYISSGVRNDRTLTFRFVAPGAKEVKLSTQVISGQQDMTGDDAGIWSVTFGPVEPEIYPYCFIADGILADDPKNLRIFPSEGFQNSLVEIPAETAQLLFR